MTQLHRMIFTGAAYGTQKSSLMTSIRGTRINFTGHPR